MTLTQQIILKLKEEDNYYLGELSAVLGYTQIQIKGFLDTLLIMGYVETFRGMYRIKN